MIRALITQLVEVLESTTYNGPKMGKAIKSAREYLATEPSGERAELIQWLRERGACDGMLQLSEAADMLEADAQPKQVTCQIYGHVVGACVECNTHIEAQQAKRVPLSDDQIEELAEGIAWDDYAHDLARRVEKHHGITPADKPTDDESEDLYALALKADNWGQP